MTELVLAIQKNKKILAGLQSGGPKIDLIKVQAQLARNFLEELVENRALFEREIQRIDQIDESLLHHPFFSLPKDAEVDCLVLESSYVSPTLYCLNLPSRFFSRILLETILKCICLGHGLLALTSTPSTIYATIKKILRELGIPDGLITFVESKNFSDFLFLSQHPGVGGLIGFCEDDQGQEILQAVAAVQMTNPKKLQLHKGAKNFLCVFDESFQSQSELLKKALFSGLGQTPWTAHRIMTTEKLEKQLQEKLISLFPKTWFPVFNSNLEVVEKVLRQIQSEEGKILTGGEVKIEDHQLMMKATLVKDLPQCSELHTLDLKLPIYFLNSVKYPFDIAKWVNLSPFGLLAVLISGPEKVQAFQHRFDVGLVLVNQWIEDLNFYPVGVKNSFAGTRDSQINGDFWATRQIIAAK